MQKEEPKPTFLVCIYLILKMYKIWRLINTFFFSLWNIGCLNCFFFWLKKCQKNQGEWISSAEEEPKPTFLVCIDLTLKMYKFVRSAVFFRMAFRQILHKMFISPLKHIQKITWVNFKNTKKMIISPLKYI